MRSEMNCRPANGIRSISKALPQKRERWLRRSGGKSGKRITRHRVTLSFSLGIRHFLKPKGLTTQPVPHGAYSMRLMTKVETNRILFFWMRTRNVWNFLS